MSNACVCECYSDPADGPDFLTVKIVTARKPHKCCECGELIQPGLEYERATGLWDGYIFDTFATCIPCMRIRDDLCACGFCYGDLWNTVWNCLRMDYLTGDFNPRW